MWTERSKKISLIILAFSIMFTIGFLANLRGILIPSIKQNLGINYSQIGVMILISGIAYMFSTFTSGFFCDRIGHKRVFFCGFILVFLGLFGLAFTRSFPALLVTMSTMCIGLGCFDIGLNSLTPKIFVANTAVMVSFMHVFYGLGSSLSPKIGSALLQKNLSWNKVYFYSIAFVAAAFLIFIFAPSLPSPKAAHSGTIPFRSLLSDKQVWLLIGILGFCESTEIGITSWMVNFLQVVRKMNEGISAQYMFFFFISYTIGRILGGYIAEKIGYVKTIVTFAATAMLLFLCALLLGNSFAFLFSVIGFFISIMFPTMITIISKTFPKSSSSVMGLIITFSGLISIGCNWLIAKLNDTVGVFSGFSSILGFASIMLLLLCVFNRVFTKNQRPAL